MKYVFTALAEKRHAGTTGDTATPSNEEHRQYWLTQGYIVEVEETADEKKITAEKVAKKKAVDDAVAASVKRSDDAVTAGEKRPEVGVSAAGNKADAAARKEARAHADD